MMGIGRARITGKDNGMDIISKMSEGNPGATRVCIEAITNSPVIDPMALLGGLAPMLSLDTLGIYGSRIWMLYKDVCGERLPYFLAMLRGWQLGLVPKEDLDWAIDNYGRNFPIDIIAAKVCERLPEFNLNWEPN